MARCDFLVSVMLGGLVQQRSVVNVKLRLLRQILSLSVGYAPNVSAPRSGCLLKTRPTRNYGEYTQNYKNLAMRAAKRQINGLPRARTCKASVAGHWFGVVVCDCKQSLSVPTTRRKGFIGQKKDQKSSKNDGIPEQPVPPPSDKCSRKCGFSVYLGA